MAMYDKMYAELGKFKQRGCKHPATGFRDGRFDGDRPLAFQGVCIVCGKVSKWAKVGRGGGFTLIF